jgi:hypothetical protein
MASKKITEWPEGPERDAERARRAEKARRHRAKNPERRAYDAEKAREWRKANPEKAHRSKLKSLYGITGDEYDAMLAAQDYKCLVCGQEHYETPMREGADTGPTGKLSRLAVDHCHDTGTVRGLLCTTCNAGLGYFYDDPELLRAAADYLSEM